MLSSAPALVQPPARCHPLTLACPPPQVRPAPCLQTLKALSGAAGTASVLLTGRPEFRVAGARVAPSPSCDPLPAQGLMQPVVTLLQAEGLHFDLCCLKPSKSPPPPCPLRECVYVCVFLCACLCICVRVTVCVVCLPASFTPEFKLMALRELLRQYPLVTTVKVWDDNPDNLTALKQLATSVTVELFVVSDSDELVVHALPASALLSFLHARGALRIPAQVVPSPHLSAAGDGHA